MIEIDLGKNALWALSPRTALVVSFPTEGSHTWVNKEVWFTELMLEFELSSDGKTKAGSCLADPTSDQYERPDIQTFGLNILQSCGELTEHREEKRISGEVTSLPDSFIQEPFIEFSMQRTNPRKMVWQSGKSEILRSGVEGHHISMRIPKHRMSYREDAFEPDTDSQEGESPPSRNIRTRLPSPDLILRDDRPTSSPEIDS